MLICRLSGVCLYVVKPDVDYCTIGSYIFYVITTWEQYDYKYYCLNINIFKYIISSFEKLPN